MATDNPLCLQISNMCRFADADGTVYDAVITEIVSTLTRVVNLSYNDGADEASNVLYSASPAAHHWGCAEDGVPRTWAETERV